MRKPPFELSDIEDESPPMKPSAPASIFTTTKPAPSWHDKPTEPGLWLVKTAKGSGALVPLTATDITNPDWDGVNPADWFGPIPPRFPADVRPEVPDDAS